MRALAEMFDRHQASVVEDVTLADPVFEGRVRPELADLCRGAVVITVGSFSKVAWGGPRVGWMRAPAPVVERTLHLRLANDLGASVPSQLMVQLLLPHLDRMAEQRPFVRICVDRPPAMVEAGVNRLALAFRHVEDPFSEPVFG